MRGDSFSSGTLRSERNGCPSGAGAGAPTEHVDEGQKLPLKILKVHTPSTVKTITSEWEEIEMGVDSGASETVLGPDMLNNIDVVDGEQKRQGVKYEVATGELIPNLGEKRFVAVSESGIQRSLTTQVAEVNQALLSVRKMIASGHRVVFDADGSYIEDKESGEFMEMKDNGSMFILKLWARRGAF